MEDDDEDDDDDDDDGEYVTSDSHLSLTDGGGVNLVGLAVAFTPTYMCQLLLRES